MIVSDTGAIIALLDADDDHHEAVRTLFARERHRWVLPWAILPEVDYLVHSHLGQRAAEAFLVDLAAGAYVVDWGVPADLERAVALCRRYRDLTLGMVDAVVMAVAERRRATAIATLDLRHFGAVSIKGDPRLLPRDR